MVVEGWGPCASSYDVSFSSALESVVDGASEVSAERGLISSVSASEMGSRDEYAATW